MFSNWEARASKPGIGQNIAFEAPPAAMNLSFLISTFLIHTSCFTSPSFFSFSRCVATASSCVWLQSKIGHCPSPQATKHRPQSTCLSAAQLTTLRQFRVVNDNGECVQCFFLFFFFCFLMFFTEVNRRHICTTIRFGFVSQCRPME